LVGKLVDAPGLIAMDRELGNLHWQARFKKLTTISSMTFSQKEDIYICGDYQPDHDLDSSIPSGIQYQAGFAKVNENSELQSFLMLLSDSTDADEL
jgi:hypothetical protein